MNALQGESFGAGFASGAFASFAGSGAQWAGWSSDGIVNATTTAGAIGSLAFGGDWYNGASLGFSIRALNHTGDDDSQERCYYLEPAHTMYIEPMPWQQPCNYNMSYSNKVGFIDTGVDYAGKGWNALSIHTKSKLTWETFKFSRDRLGYRFKTKNSDIYRKVVPQKLSYASKLLGRATVLVNVAENIYNGIQNQRVGLGNITDLGVTTLSVYGGPYGLAAGLLYLGSDYLIYKYTGKDIREHINSKYSISW
ncbi:MAG: hypothetical protein K6A78_07495 [Prevotella sp.]|nr:hypothetical protein [Prevotella sp.]